jgi:hypothetical protein
MRLPTRDLTLSAVLVALGVLIPIVFHGVGLGSVFLPMFLPIAVAPFYLSLHYAIAVGAITPVISSMFTGMPPVSPPIAQVMIFEGAVLAGLTGWLYHHRQLSAVFSLLLGLLASRLVLFLWTLVLMPLLGLRGEVFSLAWVAKGTPGVVLILLVVPILVFRFNPRKRSSGRNPDA